MNPLDPPYVGRTQEEVEELGRQHRSERAIRHYENNQSDFHLWLIVLSILATVSSISVAWWDHVRHDDMRACAAEGRYMHMAVRSDAVEGCNLLQNGIWVRDNTVSNAPGPL